MSAPRNDAGSAAPSCGVCRSTVVAMRASRSGSMCFGRARAISGFCRSISAARVFCRCATALLIFDMVDVLPGRQQPVYGAGGGVGLGDVGVVGAQPLAIQRAALVDGAGGDPLSVAGDAVAGWPELEPQRGLRRPLAPFRLAHGRARGPIVAGYLVGQ